MQCRQKIACDDVFAGCGVGRFLDFKPREVFTICDRGLAEGERLTCRLLAGMNIEGCASRGSAEGAAPLGRARDTLAKSTSGDSWKAGASLVGAFGDEFVRVRARGIGRGSRVTWPRERYPRKKHGRGLGEGGRLTRRLLAGMNIEGCAREGSAEGAAPLGRASDTLAKNTIGDSGKAGASLVGTFGDEI